MGGYIYQKALKGFSISISDNMAAKLASEPEVKYVEPDYILTLNLPEETSPDQLKKIEAQTVPWGITRVGGAGDGTGKNCLDIGYRNRS